MRHYMDETLLGLCDQLAVLGLAEDLGRGDLTGAVLLSESERASAQLLVKQDGVIAGLQFLEIVFKRLDEHAEVRFDAADGDRLREGSVAATVTAAEQALVAGERTALNFLQRMSGIATTAARFMDAIEGTGAMVFDTRKTTPGLRAFEKYAVRCGGAANHRMGLYDEIMIKENHLYLSGLALDEAIAKLRKAHPDTRLTAEAESVDEAARGIKAGADIVMLDDFSIDDIRRVVELRGRDDESVMRTQLEVSGGVTLDTAKDYAETGVERISVGALTHSVAALDLSLKVIRA